jgi:hypothetical protein
VELYLFLEKKFKKDGKLLQLQVWLLVEVCLIFFSKKRINLKKWKTSSVTCVAARGSVPYFFCERFDFFFGPPVSNLPEHAIWNLCERFGFFVFCTSCEQFAITRDMESMRTIWFFCFLVPPVSNLP